MKKEWFNNYIKEWSSDIAWEKKENDNLTGLLMEISRKNGGEILEDEQISEEDKQQYAVKKADEALQRRLNKFVRSNEPNETFRFFGKETVDHEEIKDSFIHKLVPRIELNSASEDELTGLPGIGSVTAKRIIERREAVGPYLDIEELVKVDGVSEEDYSQIKNMVYIKRVDELPMFITPELSSFLENPDFASYVQLLLKTNGSTTDNTGLNIKEKIVNELTDVLHLTAQNKYTPYKTAEYTRSSHVINQKELEKKALDIEKKGIENNNGTGLIFDFQYKQAVTELIKQTKESLYIIMFFFRFDKEGNYPTDEIVDEIIAAKKRGVDIKVILDLDKKEDPYNSEIINKGIYNHLQEEGIDVVLDAPERLTHTKTFISDNRHVIIGSHNLTAGSFYVYDDTSVFVDSEEYAAKRVDQFNLLWQEYTLIKKHDASPIDYIMEKPSLVRELKRLRITNSMTYLVNAATPERRKELSEKIQLNDDEILKMACVCDLSRLENMPVEYAIMLEGAGVKTVNELAQKDTESLSEELENQQSGENGISSVPEKELLAHWIEQAKDMEEIVEY